MYFLKEHFSLKNDKMIIWQVFYHIASEHIDDTNQWSNNPPLIQIGGNGLNSFSQNGFLSSYGSNWQLKQEKKNKQKLKKKVNFCDSSYINHCDTKSFFLTPLKKKTEMHKDKLDFRTICRMLWYRWKTILLFYWK